MIQLIIGDKGSGKTKMLVDLINESAANTTGSIVCIEKSMKLTYNISHSVRLLDVDEYGISGYDMFFGFISGVLAGNYDISEVYIDGTLKIGGGTEGLGELLDRLDEVMGDSIKAVITVSTTADNLPDSVKKYL